MLTVRKARLEDALSISTRLRKDDLEELRVSSFGDDVVTQLEDGFRESSACYVAVSEDDTPEIIFGVVPSPADPLLGYVWMLGTDAIEKNWVQVIRETRPWLNRIQGKHTVLGNAVYSKNTVHIRWLRWAGFIFLRELLINGEVFYEFAAITNQEHP